jgi:hypothetical protein
VLTLSRRRLGAAAIGLGDVCQQLPVAVIFIPL